jgi:hypothetical protein
LVLDWAGSNAITVTDTTNGALTTTSFVTVTPGAAVALRIDAPDTVLTRSSFGVTLTVLDAYNNTVTGYTGTARFGSSDPLAVLPGNYPFTGQDGGVHSFTGLIVVTLGDQTITATDAANDRVAGSALIHVVQSGAPGGSHGDGRDSVIPVVSDMETALSSALLAGPATDAGTNSLSMTNATIDSSEESRSRLSVSIPGEEAGPTLSGSSPALTDGAPPAPIALLERVLFDESRYLIPIALVDELVWRGLDQR